MNVPPPQEVQAKEDFLRSIFKADPNLVVKEAAKLLQGKFPRGLRKERIYELRNEVRQAIPEKPAPGTNGNRPWIVPATSEQAEFLRKVLEDMASHGIAPLKVDHVGDGYLVIVAVRH